MAPNECMRSDRLDIVLRVFHRTKGGLGRLEANVDVGCVGMLPITPMHGKD